MRIFSSLCGKHLLKNFLLSALASGLNEIHWEDSLVLFLHATDKLRNTMCLLDFGLDFSSILVTDILGSV